MEPDDVRAAQALSSLKSGAMPAGGFDHRAHLLVGWHLVRTRPLYASIAEMSDALGTVTAALGVPDKYDAALTRRWMVRLAERADASPDFDAFLAAHPDLMGRP